MTIGHGNWNGCQFGATIGAAEVLQSTAGMLQRCPGDLRKCCTTVVALPPSLLLLLLLGAKHGQDMYFSRRLVPSSLVITDRLSHARNRDLAVMLSLCHEPISANAELIDVFY
jgi:hypothetical protein